MFDIQAAIQKLIDETRELLRAQPLGISEWALLQRLGQAPDHPLHVTDRQDSLALFRAHFLLFHCLYRLRDELRAQQAGDLLIGALHIQLLDPKATEGQQIADPDPLRAYYLDLSHLQETSSSELDEMLGRFWARFHASDRRDEALTLLGLNDPVDDHTIRQAYRRLAMQHHPDRGGDGETLQRLHAALKILAPARK